MNHHFFDFEFVEDGGTDIMPISFGVTNLDGDHELYIEFQFDATRAKRHSFVDRVVLPLLEEKPKDRMSWSEARAAIYSHFANAREPITLWAYFDSYDFVLLCLIMGGMLSLPQGWPHRSMDIAQLYHHLSHPEHLKPPKPIASHHALTDARWDRDFFNNMMPLAKEKGLVL